MLGVEVRVAPWGEWTVQPGLRETKVRGWVGGLVMGCDDFQETFCFGDEIRVGLNCQVFAMERFWKRWGLVFETVSTTFSELFLNVFC